MFVDTSPPGPNLCSVIRFLVKLEVFVIEDLFALISWNTLPSDDDVNGDDPEKKDILVVVVVVVINLLLLPLPQIKSFVDIVFHLVGTGKYCSEVECTAIDVIDVIVSIVE